MLRSSLRGFTLIEMVLTIVIIGVVGATLAVFMKPAIDSYFATNRRAMLTEAADTVARRIERELGAALPNSIANPTSNCLVLIPATGGGRYRARPTEGGAGDVLDFAVADSGFDILVGDRPPPSPGSQVVIYNSGYGVFDAYGGGNRTTVAAGSTSAHMVLASAFKFPSPSPGNRFQVAANRADAYVCSGDKLYRFPIAGIPARPTACPSVPVGAPIFAEGVSTCALGYSAADGLATLSIGMSMEGETLDLYHEVHVANMP